MPFSSPEARRAYAREHYRAHKDTYLARNRRRYREWRAWLTEFLHDKQCKACGGRGELEFHHRDPSTKRFCVTDISPAASLADLQEEISRCDILCERCHIAVDPYRRGPRG